MVSGLDHCLTSNITAVQCIVKSHLMQCVCVGGGGGGGGGGQGGLDNRGGTTRSRVVRFC